jgi:hypothetical protein
MVPSSGSTSPTRLFPWPVSRGRWTCGQKEACMRMQLRRTSCGTPWQHRRHDQWPALGMAGALVLLAGCSFSQTPGSTSGSGAVTPGHVTVTTSKPQYRPGDTVAVTIANGLSSGILAADHQSDCTVLLIEHLTGQTWQPQNLCQLKSPTRLISFGPGTATPQQLRPPSGQSTSGWPTGSYRITLTYRQSPSGQDTTIYSAQFTIA